MKLKANEVQKPNLYSTQKLQNACMDVHVTPSQQGDSLRTAVVPGYGVE